MDEEMILVDQLVDEMCMGFYNMTINKSDELPYGKFCSNMQESMDLDHLVLAYALGRGLNPEVILDIQSFDISQVIESNINSKLN